MSAVAQFFALAAIEVAGRFAIWFIIRSKVARYLELENLLAGVRDEVRALVLELNETAARNVSLVEDRMQALHALLDDADRRIGLGKKELEARSLEREVYEKLSKRRPIVPEAGRTVASESIREPDAPITLSLGQSPEIVVSNDLAISSKTRREEALELHRRGISADLIAARLGATVAEIELLVEMEERRAAGGGSLF